MTNILQTRMLDGQRHSNVSNFYYNYNGVYENHLHKCHSLSKICNQVMQSPFCSASSNNFKLHITP